MGRFVLMMTWLPVLRLVFGLSKVFGDEHGKNPPWLVRLQGSVFGGIWATYDGWMRGVFGDGERTIEDSGAGGRGGLGRRRLMNRRDEVEAGQKEGYGR